MYDYKYTKGLNSVALVKRTKVSTTMYCLGKKTDLSQYPKQKNPCTYNMLIKNPSDTVRSLENFIS